MRGGISGTSPNLLLLKTLFGRFHAEAQRIKSLFLAIPYCIIYFFLLFLTGAEVNVIYRVEGSFNPISHRYYAVFCFESKDQSSNL